MKNLTITVKTLFGLEDVLKEELAELGYEDVKKLNRAVQLQGDWRAVYDLNLNLRCAISVLVELDSFRIREEKDIYKRAKKIDWTSLFTLDNTFAVKGAVNSTLFNHSQFPFLLVKDAIADVFRDATDERPDVDLRDPDVMIDVYVREKAVTISLNTSGVPLFQRGYRTGTGEAPLNEVVAAGLLRLSGWDRKSTLIDPFCGSGTLVIEAALMAANIPANIKREYFAFQGLKTFDEKVWKEVYAKANKNSVDLGFTIYGSDLDGDVIVKARRNAGVLPIVANVDFSVTNFKDLKKPTKNGTLITNPPYGERMGENIERMYEELGDWFKQELKGYECWVISSSEDGFKNLGLRPDRRLKLYNGSLPCSFRKFSIYEGSKRAKFNDEEYTPKPRKGKPAPKPKQRKEEESAKEQVVTTNLMDKIRKIRGEGADKYGKREDD